MSARKPGEPFEITSRGSDFLETCVRDVKSLLTTDDDASDTLTDPFDGSDVVMLWDNNGRDVLGGTAYEDDDSRDSLDVDFGEEDSG